MMKRTGILNIPLSLLVLLLASQYMQAQGVAKMINVGSLRARVMDSGDEGEGSWGWGMSTTYFNGFSGWGGIFSSKAIYLGCKSFTDTNSVTFSPKLSGHGQWETDDEHIYMPVPDKEGWTVHRYLRYLPSPITVDGYPLEDPYPFNLSDHSGPDKIPGKADAMVESWINTDMGITIHQRIIAFSQKNHDDYHIYEWTFKNTGNVDTDPYVELPTQVLDSVYFLRQLRPYEWPKPWMSNYGEMPEDTLRLMWGYPMRTLGSEWDMLGHVHEETGFLQHPWFTGEGVLFASAAVNDMTNNDPDQPHMTGYYDCDLEMVCIHSLNQNETQARNLYGVMKEGFGPFAGAPQKADARPGYHDVDIDERGYKYADEAPWWGYTLSGLYAIGPYTLTPGDSFRVVWAQVQGMISADKAWEVGQEWINDDVEPPPGMTYSSNRANCVDNLPEVYDNFPELYAADARASAESNWAKDCWVHTGKDSMFQNFAAAQWAYDNDYNVPQPPPPPSLEATSSPGKISIGWGSESEDASDFAGYRIYRAVGQWYPGIPEEEDYFLGGWEVEPIFECGEGTLNPTVVNSYDDTEAARGSAYYYYVTAFDESGLESSMFANVTELRAAYLTKEASTKLDSIRIVPNPYSIAASEHQFPGEPNKIMFMNLPLTCTIRIYSESGDLIQKIEHSGSGDEPWGDVPQQHSATLSEQVIVSGIYIAHFETPDGKTEIKKFVVVR